MKKILSLFCLIAIAWLCNVAYAETVDDVITASNLAATGTQYTAFSNVTISSGAVYAGNSAKATSGAIQLRSNNSNSGIVSTTSVGKVRKVVLEWTPSTQDASNDGKQLDVYGKNTAYTAASELYKTSNRGTKLGSITYGTTTELVITGDYEYIGLRSYNGAIYLTSITITWEKEVEATELTAPVISGVENGGVYYKTVTVKIEKPKLATSIAYDVKKDGASVYSSTEAESFNQVIAEPGTYTVSASATDGTNTLKADDVTFTIKSNKVASIAEFLATAPSFQDTEFEFDCTLIVTYAKEDSKNLYVRDETGAPLLIYMDKTASDQFEYVPENGDFFDHGVKGKYKLYNTIQELINPTFPLCNAHKNAAEPKEITIGQAADNMSQYVKIKNVKFNSTTVISCGEETIEVSGTLPADVTAQYNVVGLISQSKSSGEWLPNLLIVSYEEVQVLGTPGIEVTGATNAEGSYLDKAAVKFVYPANATSMEYVVKKGETVLEQAKNLTEDATYDITSCGTFHIEVRATDGTNYTSNSKTIKVIPSAPTVSLAAGTYYETQKLTITAPEGATLEGTLNGVAISGTSFSTTLELVAGETKNYALSVAAKKDDISSDNVSAEYTMDGQVFDAEVTGTVVIADQKDHNTTGASVSTLTLIDNNGQTFTLTRTDGSNSSYMAIYDDGLRMYKNNTYELTSDMLMTKVKFTASAYDLGNSDSENWSSPETKTFVCEAGMNKFTFNSGTSSTSKIQSIEITYAGKMHYDKVADGAALIGMEKGKFYQVNVNLQGVKANAGVLYARTSELSAKPSEPNKDYFDKSYEDYDLSKYAQRDWVAINGLTSDYEGKEVATGFIASYDGETLTPVATPAIGDAADVTNINTFSVANVFYGNYENTDKLGMANDYRPFFVKAKLNEVANFVGKVTKDTAGEGGSFRLEGSGKCGVFEGKGVLLEAADGVSLSVSGEDYKEFKGVLVAETNNTLAQYDVKIVALSAPTTPTGVAALKADGKATVYGTEGAVVVNGADGKVMIFDAMGRMVKSVNAEGAATVAMPAGYYIVRTAGTAAKVIVK